MTEILDAPSFSRLDAYEGATFTVDQEDSSADHEDDSPVDLRLDEVETREINDDWERFSLWFQSTGSLLSQGCYRLSDPQGEAFDVAISPTMTTAPDGETHSYQAMFSRQPPDKDTDPMDAIAEGDHLPAETPVGSTNGTGGAFYLGQMLLFGGTFTIRDFHQCDGTLMPITQHNALYSLLGTTYGGNGQNSFRLPNLGGRVPLHRNGSTPVGAMGGRERIVLATNQLPEHSHTAKHLDVPVSDKEGTQSTPDGNILGKDPHGGGGRGQNKIYTTEADHNGSMTVSGATGLVGANDSHSNMQPYLSMSYQICVNGLYPSRRHNNH